jgi:hypothetical protein
MAEAFPLPGSSYKELIKIIQGYGTVGENVTPADVARVVSVHETIVSKNNKFLVATGIIQGGKKKTATSLGKELARALHHDMKEEIVAKWRAVVDANDFLQRVVAAVRIRKGMDESSLESHVAYSAGQPKTPAVATGAAAVVDILRAAEMLKEEGGNLVALAPEPIADISEETGSTSLSPSSSLAPSSRVIHASWFPNIRSEGVLLNINVRIDCTAQDIEGLGLKIRKMIKELQQEESSSSARPDETDSSFTSTQGNDE